MTLLKTITFVGPDGSGKNTVAKLLSTHTGYEIVEFPNEKLWSGKRIRQILNKKIPFEAAGFQSLQNSNKKETLRRLDPKKTYINVRGKMCEIVYGIANGLPEEWVRENADQLPDPDITFLLIGTSYGKLNDDIYCDPKYQSLITELYLKEAKNHSGRVEIINNEKKEIEDIFEEAKGKLRGIDR